MPTNDDDNGKCAEATICAKCKYAIKPFWKCNANPMMNYVLGAEEHRSCGIKNPKGQCADYEERGDDV